MSWDFLQNELKLVTETYKTSNAYEKKIKKEQVEHTITVSIIYFLGF